MFIKNTINNLFFLFFFLIFSSGLARADDQIKTESPEEGKLVVIGKNDLGERYKTVEERFDGGVSFVTYTKPNNNGVWQSKEVYKTSDKETFGTIYFYKRINNNWKFIKQKKQRKVILN